MSMQPSDELLSQPSRGDAATAIAWAHAQGAQRLDQATTLIHALFDLGAAAGIDAAILVGQSAVETGNWSSAFWVNRLNPAGMGITGDPAQDAQSPTFPDGVTAARAMVAHLLLYATGTIDRGGLKPADDPRLAAYQQAHGTVATATTIADLAGTWAADPTYGHTICDRSNAMFPALADQASAPTPQPEPTTTTTTTTTTLAPQPVPAPAQPQPFAIAVPGLPGGPLVTDYPIAIDILPPSMVRNRPGLAASTPRRSVQHGNGNPNSSALGERNFLHNGAPDGNGNPQQLSYHATGDDQIVYVLIPLDEVTWQAADGNGPGNMSGFSCEMVEDDALWSDPNRVHRVIHICADFMGRVAARFGVAVPEQHRDFNWVECCYSPCDTQCGNRHDCPNKLRHEMVDGRPAWDVYVQEWQAARVDELARMGATPAPAPTPEPAPAPTPAPAPPEPPYARPFPPPPWDGDDAVSTQGKIWRALERDVTTVAVAPRLQSASARAPRIGPDIPAGTEFRVLWLVHSGPYLPNDARPENALYWVTGRGTRVPAVLCTPIVSFADQSAT